MTELVINGEPIDARAGESLVQAARRHGSHVWFVCDGRGICQTCECRVISGSAHLSRPTEIERAGMSAARRRQGYRLGCQARLEGSGAVSVVSRAEELRQRTRDVISGDRGRSLLDRLLNLGIDSLTATADLATGVAAAAPYAVPQLLRQPPTPRGMVNYVRDGLRLAGRVWRRW